MDDGPLLEKQMAISVASCPYPQGYEVSDFDDHLDRRTLAHGADNTFSVVSRSSTKILQFGHKVSTSHPTISVSNVTSLVQNRTVQGNSS